MDPHPAAAAAPAALPDDAQLIASARRALAIEARAIEALPGRIGAAFARASRICLGCHGRVVVTGMGKSGHVAGKIAATLASTGTPAFFLHPAEAGHGDLGMITRQDAVLALSNSGETPELVLLLPHVEDLMRTGEAVPRVAPDARLSAGLIVMSRKGLGMTVVVDPGDRILGVFTDGDLRRALDRQIDVHSTLMSAVMTASPKTIGPRELAAEAVHLMEVHRITALAVSDAHGRLVGALNVHDLLRAGVM